ncbi:hypothetical protein NBO_458g0007 [Nosema bombycis CQ1]|uniref:Uncharacterized protein n=1 Tax=Nosema bombycis (strain CQ1 / CVCC 102059) TaxID=578461 RepID=R0M2Y6_NOSB1|nr:hypothetical protein NBO_458g0007 [Nosema bombycis CQ1]|eukprot:EOB12364.1 hypothetical protein NBO_458g0007 [Nosema bombycis CQ1]
MTNHDSRLFYSFTSFCYVYLKYWFGYISCGITRYQFLTLNVLACLSSYYLLNLFCPETIT